MCQKCYLVNYLTGKKNAKKKGWEYDIDHAFIMQLIRQSGCKCVYCGKPFVFEPNHQTMLVSADIAKNTIFGERLLNY